MRKNRIYKVKRFSKRQREYSRTSDWLNKIRNKVRKLDKESAELQERLLHSPKVIRSEHEQEFIENETKNSKTNIYDRVKYSKSPAPLIQFPSPKDNKIYEDLIKSGKYTVDDVAVFKSLIEDNKKGISQIFWNKWDGIDLLFHEIGHGLNRINKKDVVSWLVHRGARLGREVLEMKGSVFSALLSVLATSVIFLEEKEASRKGYELLKKYNLPSRDLEKARRNLDDALKLYKLQHKSAILSKLVGSKLKRLI